MTDGLKIALGQINVRVGDVAGNVRKIAAALQRARDELNCDLVVFPELTLTGYPPEDLLLRPGFLACAERGLNALCQQIRGIDVIVGHPSLEKDLLFNAASLIRDGAIVARYHKQHLPNYGVFDEVRYFKPDQHPCIARVKGVPVGITICEDIWEDGPVKRSVDAGAALIVNLNASPFHINKGDERDAVVARQARGHDVPIVYINLVGGQDELVFDGGSFVTDQTGTVRQRCPLFEEALQVIQFCSDGSIMDSFPSTVDLPTPEESVYRAIVLGVHDYVEKNSFSGVVIGLSGGIDSALVLAIAVDALGADRVEAVLMPSRYTSDISNEDAQAQADKLDVQTSVVPIEPMFQAFLDGLKDEFAGMAEGTTEENLQARCRGLILMAISNKKHKMVLTTGNKSEMAVGYATLYGDMAGGFAAIKDVPKTLVYQLVRYRNGLSQVIPERVIERPPSAELAPDQKDSDSLPPYTVLDAILEMYIEQDCSPIQIVEAGYESADVDRVVALVDRNEYKRRQAAPGVRITRRAFGRDRRYPITNGYAPRS
ncbi:MAG TPA: NAD+ synthase [Acidiferrobacteraceae bacterium]|nr:NAD+ synthase [Acidiferrobacteraceae bacterium]